VHINSVLAAIELDNEPCLEAGKVSNVDVDGMLAPEFRAEQSPPPQ
jgi:hypothetical protein